MIRFHLRHVVGVARADFRQRSRNRTLLLAPVFIAYLGYLITGGAVTFVVGTYTGVATAAWFGGVMALAGTVLLVLFGFSLVSGTIEHDRRTGVGMLIATTPVRNTTYIIGKWLSHVALLTILVGTLMLATLGMFLLRGSGPLALWPLVSPFLLVTLPAMALVAAIVVLFETIDRLHTTAGAVVYFVLSVSILLVAAIGVLPSALDPFGISLLRDSMVSSLPPHVPETTTPRLFAFSNQEAAASTFRWPGITWTIRRIGERLMIVIAATVVVAVAGVTFDRFVRTTQETSDTGDQTDRSQSTETLSPAISEPTAAASAVSLSSAAASRHGWYHLVLAELRLALRGRRRWWYAVGGILIVAGTVVAVETAMQVILPLAWLLGLPIWAELGVRERRDRTAPLVFTSRWPLAQLGVVWFTGVLVALLFGSGVSVRLLLAGDVTGLLSILIGVLFIPSLAVCLGGLTGTSRGFEIVYLLVWYLGPINGARPLDLTMTASTGYWPLYVGGALALVGIGIAVRWRYLTR